MTKVPPNTDVDNAAAIYERGVALHDRGEISLAEDLRRSAGAAGDLGAQHNLAMLLHRRGDEASITEAEKWWRAAADAGHTGAGRNIDALAKPCPQETANE